jgi:hypothetical protein
VSGKTRIVRPRALAHALRRGPPAPTDIVRVFSHIDVECTFRDLVRRLFPDDAPAILGAGRAGRDRDAERTRAFCTAFERRYFPIYDIDDLEWLVYGIPFRRMGWSYDAFHDLDFRLGTLLLRALCAEPYALEPGARVPLLEAVEALGVPRTVVLAIPGDGLRPTDLHAALDGSRFAAAAEFADWTWAETDLIVLDCDDEAMIAEIAWTDGNVRALTEQWQAASALVDRVTDLEGWLELDPAGHFRHLLEAALNRRPDSDSDSAADDTRRTHAQDATGGQHPDQDIDSHVALPPAAAA